MRQYRVVLTPDAEADLEEIADLIAEASGYPQRALDYMRALRRQTERLRDAPMRGIRRDDLREGLRIVAVDKRCVIAFDIDDDSAIVRVLNYFYGGRDYDALIGAAGA